jgi:hypothetical protein
MPQRVAGGVHEDTLTVVNEPEDAQ